MSQQLLFFLKPTSISIDEASNKKVACSCFIFDKKNRKTNDYGTLQMKKNYFFLSIT